MGFGGHALGRHSRPERCQAAAHRRRKVTKDHPARFRRRQCLRVVVREPDHSALGIVEKALDRALIAIVDGIESGVFVGRAPAPGGWKTYVECPYCDPDALGTTDRHREWLRKVAAPELAGYLELVGIELPEEDTADDSAPAVEQLALL